MQKTFGDRLMISSMREAIQQFIHSICKVHPRHWKRIILFYQRSFLLFVIQAIIVGGILMSIALVGSTNTGVSVNTDKIEYKGGESIKIILTNNLGQSIFSHIRSGTPVFCIKHIEKKTTTGEWERLYAQCQFPHCTADIDAPGEIKPDETETMDWNPLVFVNGTSETVIAEPGLYRLLISYEDYQKTKWESVYTNEFTIHK